MLRHRRLFPAIYRVLFLPAALRWATEVRVAVVVVCLSLAFLINFRAIRRFLALVTTALLTLVPLLILVQSAVCTSATRSMPEPFAPCVVRRSLPVLLNVGSLSAVFLLAAANEWRGSLVMTI